MTIETIATCDTTPLDLGALETSESCAGYGRATDGVGFYGGVVTGYGLYGRCDNSGFGAVGIGNSDAGVGVSGGSDTGIGVQAQSISGAPLNIVAGSQPTTGTRQAGDIYVDTDGNMWLWAKNTSNVFVWRKVQLV